MAQPTASSSLASGARVAVIGGGPAGAFCALNLFRFARQSATDLHVTIFERKDFTRRGPAGCNKCAGILSTRAARGLADLGLRVPPQLIMAELDGYTLHLAGQEVQITAARPARSLLSVYRGAGPLRSMLDPEISFDGWLLDAARAEGAEIRRAGVQRLAAGPRPVVESEAGAEEFDLVVLAAGVNGHTPAIEGWPYRPPATATMAQDEFELAAPLSTAERRHVQVFVGDQPGLMFGALVPKGEFLNLSLLGLDLPKDAIATFLARPDCNWLEAAGAQRLCGCRPRIAVAAARHSFGERFVAVGDAAATRLYKDGIGSAYITARQAAWTALHLGVSAASFDRGYAPLCEAITRDNQIGRLLFWLWQQGETRPFWVRSVLRTLISERAMPAGRRRAHLALWNLLTGDASYTRIARGLIHPDGVSHFLAALLAERRSRPATAGGCV